jgi:hypothetical protein
MDVAERFKKIEQTLLARFEEAADVNHKGDRGENREKILREFLEEHLPRRYGVAKGEVVTRDGDHSHSADIIVYDAHSGPVLYAGDTAILPVEAVYGIIEVKSRLSKAEFVDASKKVESFKRLAPRDLSVIRTREYVTVHRPSRPSERYSRLTLRITRWSRSLPIGRNATATCTMSTFSRTWSSCSVLDSSSSRRST